MTRGFASGLIWGGVMSVLGAAALSVATPLPPSPSVGAATETVAQPRAVPDQPGTPPAAEQPPAVRAETAAPGAPAPDSTDPVAAATDTAKQPVIGVPEDLAKPAAPAETKVAPVSTLSPAPKTAPAGGLVASEAKSEDPGSISTQPAQPSAPKAAETSGFAAEKPGADSKAQTDAQPKQTTPPKTEPQVAALPQAGADDDAAAAPAIGTQVVPLTERSPGASTRLPVAGADETPAPVAAAAPAPADDAPPIRRFAAAFENPEAKPLMSIVLIDDAQAVGTEALASFPYPLTFAVNTSDPDAAAKMARHRAAGFEVLALVDLDPSSTPQDAETVLAATFGLLSETIGMLEGTSGGIQGNRALSDQVTEILRDGGYGLITQANGLDTVQKLALREGVPSAVVFRDFDGAGQTPTVMRRFLDQAAFRAGQGDPVVMLGRVRPDTVSALLLWGLQDRAAQVQLAPASAVLTAAVPGSE